jgi:nicotinate-nucleotide pyrophosphorylase (carboxylating)
VSAPLDPPSSPDPNDLTLPDLWAWIERSGLPGRLFELARDEDLGPDGLDWSSGIAGDHADTSGALGAGLVFREAGVVCGLVALRGLIETFGGCVSFAASVCDGDLVGPGGTAAIIEGDRGAVLRLERTLLNLVGRLSGVATRTRAFVRALEAGGGAAKLYDTRKTTPGLRVLEKYAVRCGGGMNHRFGLHDAVMLKDNHLAGNAGGDPDDGGTGRRVALLLDRIDARSKVIAGSPPRFVEVEVDRVAQLESVLATCAERVDVVLLDNMALEDLRASVEVRDRIAPDVVLEASGGVSLETVGAIGTTGVDRVSVGSLTHGARGLDVGLDLAPA